MDTLARSSWKIKRTSFGNSVISVNGKGFFFFLSKSNCLALLNKTDSNAAAIECMELYGLVNQMAAKPET